jgi:flagellar protein FliS
MTQNPALAYRHDAVLSASPLGLVVLLYDAALKSLNRAIRAIEAHDIEQRVQALNHVLSILAHFQQTLDLEQGGEVARNLDHFYHAGRAMIMEATFSQSADPLKELAGQMQDLRDSWKEAERRESGLPEMLPYMESDMSAGGIHWSA